MDRDAFKREYMGEWHTPPGALTSEETENEYYLALSDKLLPFIRKRCPECKGKGTVMATNAPVPVKCGECNGSGLLKDVPAQAIKHGVEKDMPLRVVVLGIRRVLDGLVKSGRIAYYDIKQLKNNPGVEITITERVYKAPVRYVLEFK